jgi:hypothetical protein
VVVVLELRLVAVGLAVVVLVQIKMVLSVLVQLILEAVGVEHTMTTHPIVAEMVAQEW